MKTKLLRRGTKATQEPAPPSPISSLSVPVNPKAIPDHVKRARDFAEYLRETIIPELQESGNSRIATHLRHASMWIERLAKDTDSVCSTKVSRNDVERAFDYLEERAKKKAQEGARLPYGKLLRDKE